LQPSPPVQSITLQTTEPTLLSRGSGACTNQVRQSFSLSNPPHTLGRSLGSERDPAEVPCHLACAAAQRSQHSPYSQWGTTWQSASPQSRQATQLRVAARPGPAPSGSHRDLHCDSQRYRAQRLPRGGARPGLPAGSTVTSGGLLLLVLTTGRPRGGARPPGQRCPAFKFTASPDLDSDSLAGGTERDPRAAPGLPLPA
jgi:hypothetical protein